MLIHEICKQSKTDGPFSFITRKMMQIMYSQGIKAYMELNILLLFCFYPINIEIDKISVVVSIATCEVIQIVYQITVQIIFLAY